MGLGIFFDLTFPGHQVNNSTMTETIAKQLKFLAIFAFLYICRYRELFRIYIIIISFSSLRGWNDYFIPFVGAPSYSEENILYLKFYFMNRSVASRASNASSKMLEELANRSQTKILKVEGTFNDQEMRVIWNALGLYISRNLRMGRGVSVPRLGIFTFTPPEVRLKGVTNEGERDQQPRTPVFLIQKDFLKGINLRTAIFYQQQFGSGLRPYSAIGATGEIPVTKLNLIEVSSYANMSKDATELGINRIIKYISEKILTGQSVSMEIPNLGQLVCRNHLVALKFNDYLMKDTRNVLARSVDERKMRGNMSLTTDNLKKFANMTDLSFKLGNKGQQFFDIDDKARQFLSTNFNIHMDDSNYKRSMTNFDRTVASKIFDRTNQSLKNSYSIRMTQSGFFPGQTGSSKQFNMALRIIKEWIRDNHYSSVEGYNSLCELSQKKTGVLTSSDFWNACKQISIDITEQQCLQLFRIMDNNKDGVITLEDWTKNINFDQNNRLFRDLIQFLKQKKYVLSKVLSLLGLEGIRKVSSLKLKDGLIRLKPDLTEEDAILLSKFIARGKDQLEVERIIDALNIKEDQQVEVDSEWQTRFLQRLKNKLQDSRTTEEELLSKFRLYDQDHSGFIEQTDFKTVLGELGISLNLTELIKVVRFIPINKQNHLKYQSIIDKLSSTESGPKSQLSEGEFRSIMKIVLDGNKTPFALPISVSKLTSYLQSKHFNRHQQSKLLPFVRSIDINEDEQIDSQDLRRFKELLSDKTYKDMSSIEIEKLLIKLRQKRIKKKISFYDLFRKLDKVGSGFITHQGWLKNINEIMQFTFEEKQNLFHYMDKQNNNVVDYKTFLAIMNADNSLEKTEKFDWVELCLARIKEWHTQSGLTIEDAFKLIDRDADTYITEKDLHYFLREKLKYQERELSMVRLQKLMKIMDCYKHGRINFIDWFKIISEDKDWLSDAKQQIGIVLSKHYPSLSEAFFSITTGDKKMLFSAFDKWVRSNHVLSGFMINQDIMKHIFNRLDQHKKGYLFQNDFLALFGAYDWKSQHCKEVTDYLKVKFNSSEEAYRYMAGYSNRNVDYERFQQVVHEFFGNRFQPSDIKNIWKTIAGGKDALDVGQFKKLHGNFWPSSQNAVEKEFPKDSWKYQDFSIIKGTTVRSNEFQFQEKEKMEDQCNKFINNVKDIIASSPKTLEQVFSEVDKQKSGRITNLMFKKAFRTLNIALTSKQIDLLLNYCEFKSQTLIDWKKFIKQLDLHEDKQNIRARLQPRLQHISDLMHYYMISPKDAFRKWNNPRIGYLNFEEFHKMIKELYSQASEKLPEYQQIEDLFRFIDIRRDNQIDFQEFTQVFRTCTPPSLLMGTTPALTDQMTSKLKVDKEAGMPNREKSIPRFRHSPAYEQFVQLIGRNRRYIEQRIQEVNPQKAAFIAFSCVEEIVREICGKQGLQVDSEMIRNLIAFAMTGQKVDYQLLVSKFKDLSVQINEFPKMKVY